MIRPAYLEVLEARIAPAHAVFNPVSDIIVGAGTTGKIIELSQLFDPLVDYPGHTIVTFTLNYDADQSTPAIEPTQIKLELFDDEAPLTVQNFLRYLESSDDAAAAFVDTFFHRSVSNFVLQGGGFSIDDPKTLGEHIETFGTVHNEFSADRSNLRGTIAMAKVATNENTASSEWFVNLADNSGNLDTQNGGFTVFGRVIEGMDIIDKIAALPKANLGGALTDVPVQKMNPDPDNNPNTLSPTPSEDNVIRVTGISIAEPELGQVQGLTYGATVVQGEGNPNVVTATVDPATGKLQLNFNPSQNGVATIQVTATHGGETVMDSFTVTLRPNLIALVSEDVPFPILLPNEGGKTEVTVKNNGGANFTGAVTVNFYMSSRDGQNGDDPEGTILDKDDDILLLGSLVDETITVNADGEFVLKSTIFVPPELIKGGTDDYRLLVEIVPAAGATQELFTDDNVAVDGGIHVLTNQFGTVDFSSSGLGKRDNVKLTYLDPATNRLVTLSLKGPGTGQVTLDEGDEEDETDDRAELLIADTTMASKLKIAALGIAKFSKVEVTDAIGKIDLSIVSETGDVSLAGGAKKVVFGNVTSETRLTIGAPQSSEPVSIKLGRVADLVVESSQAIKSLQALEWRDLSGAEDSITAPSIAALKITGDQKLGVRGDFEADVDTYTTVKLGSISVAGLVSNAIIQTQGDIGNVTVGGLINSSIFAGTDGRPDALSDFDSLRTIQSVNVKGITADAFSNSQVAAATISKIVVRNVDANNDDVVFGFVADKVGKYNRVGASKLSNLSEPGTPDEADDYKLVIL